MAGAGRQLQLRARLHSASIVVQLFSCVRLLATPGAAARQTSLSITNSPSLLKLTSNESLMPSKHFLLCRPLLLPSVFPSIRVSSNEPGLHIRWPNDWSFSFSISPSSGHSGLIPFRMDLLAVPGTLKSLLVSVGCRVVLLDVLVSKHLIKKRCLQIWLSSRPGTPSDSRRPLSPCVPKLWGLPAWSSSQPPQCSVGSICRTFQALLYLQSPSHCRPL